MNITMIGASGFVGTRLLDLLKASEQSYTLSKFLIYSSTANLTFVANEISKYFMS